MTCPTRATDGKEDGGRFVSVLKSVLSDERQGRRKRSKDKETSGSLLLTTKDVKETLR